MNLAWKDVRRQWQRFLLTSFGLGLLFAVVLAMGGIYRGLVEDATLLVKLMETDLWLVQRDTRGPFAERSTLPAGLADRIRSLPGVANARTFSFTTLQREHAGRPLRLALVGLGWPNDKGQQLPLHAGRSLQQAHREMIADVSLGLALGEIVPLGDAHYTVVGLTKGVIASGGDGIAFVTFADAAAIQAHQLPAAQREVRDGLIGRLSRSELNQPTVVDRLAQDRGLPVNAPPPANAILVRLSPGADGAAAHAALARRPEVTAYTTAEQEQLLLTGVVEKARMQLGLFRVLLVIVSAIIVALIIYTMTMAKSREIALLKLMGARTGVIVGLILQQSLMLGLLGYGLAVLLGAWAFPRFPRRVVLTETDFLAVGALALGICLVASLAGIAKALKIPPTTVLAG